MERPVTILMLDGVPSCSEVLEESLAGLAGSEDRIITCRKKDMICRWGSMNLPCSYPGLPLYPRKPWCSSWEKKVTKQKGIPGACRTWL